MVGVQADVEVALGVHALGPVRVTRGGDELRLGGPRQRRLLAILLIHRGAVVSVDRVAEAVFEGEPTDAAATTLRSYVARLRRVLGDDLVLTRAPGYQLALPARAFDVAVVETWVEEARAALQRQDPVRAAELVRRALDAWQGEAYAEFADEPWAYPESQRLGEVRLTAQELLVEAELACGHTATVLPIVESLCREHPLREGFRGQLMTAYYRSGRQADALAVFRAFRQELADELGIDPSPALVALERQVLAQDPLLEAGGEPLRGYRLGERLGTGRDGTVHAAALAGIDRPLVIRTVRAALADDPAFIRTFEATAHRVASLRHPAVVRIHDYWREPGAAHVVMPRLPGGTLRDRLVRGPLAERELVALVERIGGALARAAAADLVHGRVTPENVLYDGAGDPVLVDFWLGGPVVPKPTEDVAGLASLVEAAAGSPGPRLAAVLASPPEDIERLVADLLAALGKGAAPSQSRNPYQGLRAFDEADEEFYFGRAGLVDELAGRFADGRRLVLLVGASGTGKSSAVRAGLLPRLRQAEHGRDWFVATMLPGGAPYDELAEALRSVAVAPVPHIDRGRDGIDAAVRDVVAGDLLLVLDQFEELFTLSPDEEQRDFLAALTRALTVPDSRLRVVATIRADYYDRPLGVQPFGSLVQDATVTIPAMLPGDIEAAVVEPALRVGRAVDRALAAELVGAVSSEPAALPALQFVLYELAERGALTHAAYRKLGGLDGAIAARAEELYQSLDDTDRAHVRELFERLVVVGEGEPTRRRATRDEAGSADALVDSWAAARLLTLDVDPQTRAPTVEVAHEALVREWPRLREWLEADRSELVVLARVRDSARTWAELDRDRAALLRGTALEAAVEVTSRRAALPPLEQEYVEQSRLAAEEEQAHQVMLIRRQGRTNRRLRWQLGGIGVMLVLALVGGFVALDQRREAVSQRHTAVARELAAAASENLRDDPERSILLSLAAIDATRRYGEPVLPEAVDSLHRAIGSNRVLRSFPGIGGDLDWSPDGRLFSTEGPEDTGLLTVHDARSGEVVQRMKADHVDINSVAFSPDSRHIASAGDGGIVRVWDVETGRRLAELPGEGAARGLDFSRDGRLLAVGHHAEGRVAVYRWRSQEQVASYAVTNPSSVAFDADASRLAVADWHEGDLVVFDVASSRPGRKLGTSTGDVVWSPDGRWLAATSERVVQVYDARTMRLRAEVQGHSAEMSRVAWSPDSRRIATGGADGTAKVFTDTGTGFHEIAHLAGQDLRSGVFGLAFSPDGSELMTGDQELRSVKVWDLRGDAGAEVASVAAAGWDSGAARFGRDGSLWLSPEEGVVARVSTSGEVLDELPGGHYPYLALSPDGELVAVFGESSLEVRSTAPGHALAFSVPTDNVEDLAWSPDAQRLALAYQDGILVIGRDGDELARLPAEEGTTVRRLTWAGDRLVSTAAGFREQPSARGIRVWDWQQQRLVRRITTNAQQVTADDSGRLVASAGIVSGIGVVWDLHTGRQVARLEGHSGQIQSLEFDATGRRLATAGTDGTVRLWDARTGVQLGELDTPTQAAATGAQFSPDGRRLLTVWDDDRIRVFTLDVDELVEIGRGRLTRQLTDAECRRYLHVDSCR